MVQGGTGLLLERTPPAEAAMSDELRDTLRLVQETVLKVVRFQLAMNRQDRRLAMQSIDDVMMLERKIADLLNDAGDSGEDLSEAEARLAEERSALLREKFTLAAGRIGFAEPSAEPPPADPVDAADEAEAAEAALAPTAEEDSILATYNDSEPARRSLCMRAVCALAALGVVAAASGGWAIAGGDMPDWQSFPALLAGGR